MYDRLLSPSVLIAFVIAAVVTLVGLRLAARGVVRRAGPELALGIAVALLQPGIALLNYALQVHAAGLASAALACVTAGTAAIAVFAKLTFRTRAAWASLVIVPLVAFLCYGHVLQLPPLIAAGEPHLVYLSARMLLIGWAAFEALRHRALYARRQRIGLYNPVIGNRFLLFGVWTSLMAFNAAGTILIVLLGQRFGLLDWRTWTFGMARGISLFLVVALWLIFFPPLRYLAWIERRHVTRHQTAAKA